MKRGFVRTVGSAVALPAMLAALTPVPAFGATERFIVVARSAAGRAALMATSAGVQSAAVLDLPELNAFVVSTSDPGLRTALQRSPDIAGIAADGVRTLFRPRMRQEFLGRPPSTTARLERIAIAPPDGAAPLATVTGDPTMGLPGLMWNVRRVRAPQSWQHPNGTGFPSILVGVADTGLDYTHHELTGQVTQVVDFTLTENPALCPLSGLPTDAQLAIAFGAPSANLDFNGHGTWIGGNIAARLDGTGVNGIAPDVRLVSLKIAQNCGSAYDSTIISAFLYAANAGIDVVSISFGGYLDRADPAQDLTYRLFQQAVSYALRKGTLIVAAAGNEHLRLGAGGRVLSHGILDLPPGGTDYFGLWEVPAGLTGVVAVSATANVANGASTSCPADSLAAGAHQWCKPATDKHRPQGVGRANQLAYYSNYGPRIDFAAPGGARKFNLPADDRGGTEGWPWTGSNSVEGGSSVADGTKAWEDFAITSNYATEIPCFTFTSNPSFPDNQCYAIIQGTSMATPHVSAALAILAGTHPEAWHRPALLLAALKAKARPLAGNATRPLSATDKSKMDLSGATCPGGYCHLGGVAIPDLEAYGNGLISVY